MTDYGLWLRQKFISEYTVLEAKRADLRERMHAEGKAFIGEELLAAKLGLKLYDAKTKWGWK